MRNICKYIIPVAAALLLASQTIVSAQKTKTDRIQDAMILDAVEVYDRGDYKNAAEAFKRILSLNNENDAAHYYLGLCYIAENEADAAESELATAVSLDPQNYWYRQRLAALYRYSNQLEAAEQIYEKLLDDFPKKSELYFDLAEIYVASGKNEKALETINSIETVFGPSEAITLYRFRLLVSMGRQEEARQSLKTYNEKYSSPSILSALGDESLAEYDTAAALAYYEEALELQSDYAPALLGKVEIQRMTSNYSDYFVTLRQFMSSENIAPAAKTEYLKALLEKTDPRFVKTFVPKIDSCVNDCFRVHPSDTAVIVTVASYYYSTARREVGKDLFQIAVNLAPSSRSLLDTYLYVLYDMEAWSELAEESAKASSRFPQVPDYPMLEGTAYYGLKEYDKLIRNCESIIKQFPKDSSATVRAYSTMGDTYHLMGQSKNAYKAYDKALKIAPDNVYVLNNYAYYLSMNGEKLKKAYAMSKKTVEAHPDEAIYLDTFGWILFLQGKALEAKPFFKHAMLYGGKDSAVILDHYAEVLFALKEYDLAFVYWNKALMKKDKEVPGLEAKISQRRAEMKKNQSKKK